MPTTADWGNILTNAHVDNEPKFYVVAGKYDGNEENCKYASCFSSFVIAMMQWQNVSDYPWARIEWYSPNGFKYDITPRLMERNPS